MITRACEQLLLRKSGASRQARPEQRALVPALGIWTSVLLAILSTAAFAQRPWPAMHDGSNAAISLMKLGARCDGSADDSAALRIALLGRYADITGESRWCAVRGNFVLLSRTRLHHVWLRQLDGAGHNRRTLTTPGGSTVSDILLEDVKVDRNGRREEGNINDDAGIWLANIRDSELRDVEVTGDGKGIGIFVLAGTGVADHIKVVRASVHDMHWSARSDPCTEQIVGLWFSGATNIEVDSPRIANLLGEVGDGKYCQLDAANIPPGVDLPYQTDGLDFSNTHGARISGGLISSVGEGSDNSGRGRNRNIWYFGTHYTDCGTFCLKMVHDIADSGSVNIVALRPGLAGIVLSDGAQNDAAGPTGITHKHPTIIDAGAPFDYGRGKVRLWDRAYGIRIQHASNGAGPPVRNIRLVAPVIVDDQRDRTMTVGIERELPGQDVRIDSPTVRGALVSSLSNFGSDGRGARPTGQP